MTNEWQTSYLNDNGLKYFDFQFSNIIIWYLQYSIFWVKKKNKNN